MNKADQQKNQRIKINDVPQSYFSVAKDDTDGFDSSNYNKYSKSDVLTNKDILLDSLIARTGSWKGDGNFL